MLYTEQNVRDNIRTREGKRVFYLREEDRLTSAARDYLRSEHIEILPAQQAKPDCYRLENGAILLEKPEHMTHLQALRTPTGNRSLPPERYPPVHTGSPRCLSFQQ